MPSLDTSIVELGPIAKRIAPKLTKLGLVTVRDLLLYFPFRYDDFRTITPIAQLQNGMTTTIHGTIRHITTHRSWRKHMLLTEALIEDSTGTIRAVWFRQPYVGKILKPGMRVSLAGELHYGSAGLELRSPNFEKEELELHTGRLVPIYPITAGISQKQLRTVIATCITTATQCEDPLPSSLRATEHLIPYHEAITTLHFPEDEQHLICARHCMAFHELLILQLTNQLRKSLIDQQHAHAILFSQKNTQATVQGFPFTLTHAQRKAAWEILQDLERTRPMTRLLEGDVGSGKTAVAAIAAASVAHAGLQTVVLAPTDTLARQHCETFIKLLPTLTIGLLTRTTAKINNPNILPQKAITTAERKKLMPTILEAPIIIGTHALLQEYITIPRCALVIIDEQQRFGVHQRATLALRDNNYVPHVLSMTATPIPRSLALAIISDLDVSILDELPAGRKHISTHVVPPKKRDGAYRFIETEIKKGRQVYVVCPLIDPSDILGVKSATETYQELTKIFPHLAIGLLHGKLSGKQKEEVRQQFLNNTIQILVATTVVEVGVDVPNATVMLIEGAERFGLAQLWQLRGRVGRSEHASWCFLFTSSSTDTATQRLQFFVRAKNGFEVAEADLKLRGPGMLTGTEQSGWLELQFASLADSKLISHCRQISATLLKKDPTLQSAPLLKKQCEKTMNTSGLPS